MWMAKEVGLYTVGHCKSISCTVYVELDIGKIWKACLANSSMCSWPCALCAFENHVEVSFVSLIILAVRINRSILQEVFLTFQICSQDDPQVCRWHHVSGTSPHHLLEMATPFASQSRCLQHIDCKFVSQSYHAKRSSPVETAGGINDSLAISQQRLLWCCSSENQASRPEA